MTNPPILQLRGITKRFPGVLALDNVDFEVAEGEVHALIGENGAGKSTLIKILGGVYSKDAGEIYLRGKQVNIESPARARDLGISVIHQELNLVPFFNTVQNMSVGREYLGLLGWLRRGKMEAEARQMLSALGVDLPIHVPVKKLSIAQQQMIAIARALAERSAIIVMDEPTSMLTSHEIDQLFTIVRRLRDQGVTIIYISHRLEEIFELADRVTVLKDGKVVNTLPIKSIDSEGIVELMVGRSLEEKFFKRRVPIGDVLLEVRGLSDGHFLNDIDLTVRAGEIVGIVGPVGSGRTELVRAIFGAGERSKGEIRLSGNVALVRSPADAIDLGMALVPEDRRTQGLVMHMDVANNIALPSLQRWSVVGFIRESRVVKAVRALVSQLAIRTPSIRQRVRYLSGGNQQKVIVAKWLGKESRLFLLDEPTKGIDVGAKIEIYHLIAELVSHGAGVIFISAEIPECLGIADRIIVLRQGRIVAQYKAEEATPQKILNAVISGNGDFNKVGKAKGLAA